MMKVNIPLDASLCTDSHPGDIKDPASGRDLFSKNHAYLFNRALSNAKKDTVPAGNYITTRGDTLQVVPGSEKTQIYHNGNLIADVRSMGVEDISYLDKDDAVIDAGSLWTVQKTFTGYIFEQTDLRTKEVTSTDVEYTGAVDIRFVRNTHKIIIRNIDGSVTIDGQDYINNTMRYYMANFNGEFIAAEINGKIYFGYNNPVGVEATAPTETLSLSILANTNGWSLRQKMDENESDQNTGYTINITIANNIQIGAGNNLYAMDLLTGITNPQKHIINLTLGAGVIISGKGGDGSNVSYRAISFPRTNGGAGAAAIYVGSTLNILGSGTIQGGGGGGGGAIMHLGRDIYVLCAGGGGAGSPAGKAGIATKYDSTEEAISGQMGSLLAGGIGGEYGGIGGGGDGGLPGEPGYKGNITGSYTPIYTENGPNGNAILIMKPATWSVTGPTVLGGIVQV